MNAGAATLERTAPPRSFTAPRRVMLRDREELRLIKLYRTYRSDPSAGLTKSLDGSVGGSVAPDLDDDEALGRNGDVQGAILDHNVLWWKRKVVDCAVVASAHLDAAPMHATSKATRG